MYKNKIGRYILAIGSNEEATRLSGVNTDKYKIIAYVITGISAGIAAIFWSSSFVTVAAATGNGMELDAIAGVYIGGTSATGGIASVTGSVIGAIMLVVIRSGLNFVLALFNINVNSTYVTYVLTGVIVVFSVLFDKIKDKITKKGCKM
jgi:ribose transport system permease protein